LSELLPADAVIHGTDHSSTYKFQISEWRNFVHILRLRKLLKLIRSYQRDRSDIYIDVGCSNGYITSLINEMSIFSNIYGFDYDDQNLVVARGQYPTIQFSKLDLNLPFEPTIKGDVVSCFETIEHVGDMDAAVRGLMSLTNPDGRIILSVPIEIGLIGIIKYLAKIAIYRYDDLEELPGHPSKWQYFRMLISGNVSHFRRKEARREWGTHFGFDYRELEAVIKKYDPSFQSYTYATTRIFTMSNRQ
jgi:SAM-dependent methyltransferase